MKQTNILFFSLFLLITPALNVSAYDVDSLLQEYSTSISRHSHFSAPFTQSRYLSVFEKPLVSEGTIKFSAPDRILLHYTRPFESLILFSRGTFMRYRVQNGDYIKQPSLEIVTRAITREMTRWLSANFTSDFPYTAIADSLDPRHLLLTPGSTVAQSLFSGIELYFPENPEYIKKVKLVESNGDSIVITHGKPSFHPLDEADFVIPVKK